MMSYWVSMIVFGLVFAFVVGWTRGSLGPEHAQYTSRYTTAINLFWLGVVGVAVLAVSNYLRLNPNQFHSRNRKLVIYGNVVFAVVFVFLHLTSNLATFSIISNFYHARTEEGAKCIIRMLVLRDNEEINCSILVYHTDTVPVPVETLAKYELSTFTRAFAVEVPLPKNDINIYVPLVGQLELMVPADTDQVLIYPTDGVANPVDVGQGTSFVLSETYGGQIVRLTSPNLNDVQLVFESAGKR